MSNLEPWRQPPMPLRPGQEWWVDTAPRLAVRLARETRAGRVAVISSVSLGGSWRGALVTRMQSRRRSTSLADVPVWAWVTLAGAMVTGVMAVLLVSVARTVTDKPATSAIAFVVILVALLAARVVCRPRQRHRCSGLHCAGCGH